MSTHLQKYIKYKIKYLNLQKIYQLYGGNIIKLGINDDSSINLMENIDVQLINMDKSTKGNTGRYKIGTRSLGFAKSYITKVTEGEVPSDEEIKSFLICISAILQQESSSNGIIKEGGLQENTNVRYEKGELFGFSGDTRINHISIIQLKKQYEMFKLQQLISDTGDLATSRLQYIDYLKSINKSVQILYNVIFTSGSIPYVLLKKNIYGFYDLPIDVDGDTFYTYLMSIGLIVEDGKKKFDSTAIDILLVKESIDEVVNSSKFNKLYKFVRLENLIELARIIENKNFIQLTEHYNIQDNILYVRVGKITINISIDVLHGIGMFNGFRNFMHRVFEIDLTEYALLLNGHISKLSPN
jgi:hypothetical protein